MGNKEVYSVKQLSTELRNLLEASYRSIWVEGEVSGLACPASGHKYFSLKEENSVLGCAYFRNRQRSTSPAFEDGMQVLARGQISYYEPRGNLQFIVSHLELAGEGALRRAFEELKQKLFAEGLFADQHKLPLPGLPQSIGVITSTSGAALQDILAALNRRYPVGRVVIYPASVQGDQAPGQIIEALGLAQMRNEVEVIILARGGGSLEDLQAFNDERVARAVFDCSIPVVSGVGHEIDITIADFVSDHRAPTPTAAAELVAPHMADTRKMFVQSQRLLYLAVDKFLRQHYQSVDYLTARLVHPARVFNQLSRENAFLVRQLVSLGRQYLGQSRNALNSLMKIVRGHSPSHRTRQVEQHLEQLTQALKFHCTLKVQSLSNSLNHVQGQIHILGPQHTLDRGYAIVQDHRGDVIFDPVQVENRQRLWIKVSKGQMTARVDDD